MAGAAIANDSFRGQGKRLSEMNHSLGYGFDVPLRHPLSESGFGNSVYQNDSVVVRVRGKHNDYREFKGSVLRDLREEEALEQKRKQVKQTN